MNLDLFDVPATRRQDRDPALDQFFTPEWAAAELIAEAFPGLGESDFVIEPSCGRGAFLKGIPAHVPAMGVEIDEPLAREARANTGREIRVGDFRDIPLPAASAIVGNPPFNMRIFDGFLDRCAALLPEGGKAAFLLPSYAVQTPRRVLRWGAVWSLRQWIIPRTLFPRSRLPLVFLQFIKEPVRQLVGFALYREAAEITGISGWARAALVHGTPGRPTWRALVDEALRRLGGQARLDSIYAEVDRRRPAGNQWWKEKIRQTLQRYAEPVRVGEWRAKSHEISP